MKVTRTSKLTGVTHTREIPITEADLIRLQDPTLLIQQAVPSLSADDREFLVTGATPEEWDEAFGEEE